MSIRGDIRAALNARLFTVSGFPITTRRHLENAPGFTVPIGFHWARIDHAFHEDQPLTKQAEGAILELSGRMTVTLFEPQETGTAASDTLADAVLAAFPYGWSVVVGSDLLQIERSRRWSGSHEAGDVWYMTPVDVRWYLRTVSPL